MVIDGYHSTRVEIIVVVNNGGDGSSDGGGIDG